MNNCWMCKESKPREDFYIRKSGRPRSECKKCTCLAHSNARKANKKCYMADRNWKLKSKYGINQTQYLLMLIDQGSRCAICSTHTSDLKKILRVDHCHNTGKVRKLLCDLCNTGLGLFKESPERLIKAAEYLGW